MNTIHAPFTADQVARLKEWQSGMMWQADIHGIERPMATHPFTCGGEDRSQCPNKGILIPETEGFRCPCGAYKQDWCHDFMAVHHEPSELAKLFKRVLMLAEEKGYPYYDELINPFIFNFWQIDGLTFIMVSCMVIHKWLLDQYKILVWVEPKTRHEGIHHFTAYCDLDSQDMGLATIPVSNENESSYEYVWLSGIEYALKILPPAASQSDLLG